MSSSPTAVVVVGGGYAGVTAANRLRSSLTSEEAQRVRIIMVNRTPDFVERIRLHEVAAGTRLSAARPLRDMLHEDICVMVGDVAGIDPVRRVVDLVAPNGRRLERYDALVYSVGSVAAAEVPGAKQFAHLLANPDGALTARDAIAAAGERLKVVVVGGGPTGVEAAAEIAERHPEATVTLLSGGDILAFMTDRARRRIRRTLGRLGVVVRENAWVARILEGGIELADGTRIASDVTILASSFAVPTLAGASGLAVDEIGRLRVDESLRSLDYPDIVGAGDAVRPPASVAAHLRMSCAMAIPLGGHAADTVLHQLRGTEPRSLSAGFAVQCLSLGRRRGYIQFVHPDDVPRRWYLAGLPGAKVKEAICRMVVTGSRKERLEPGSIRTVAGPKGPR